MVYSMYNWTIVHYTQRKLTPMTHITSNILPPPSNHLFQVPSAYTHPLLWVHSLKGSFCLCRYSNSCNFGHSIWKNIFVSSFDHCWIVMTLIIFALRSAFCEFCTYLYTLALKYKTVLNQLIIYNSDNPLYQKCRSVRTPKIILKVTE